MFQFNGPLPVVERRLIRDAECKGPTPVIIINGDIIKITRYQGIGRKSCSSLIVDISHAGHLRPGFIEYGHLSPAHASQHITSLQVDGQEPGDGLEPEPDILHPVVAAPAGARALVLRSKIVGVFCIGRTPVIVRDINGPVLIVEGQFVIQTKTKGPAPVIVIDCYVVSVPDSQGINDHPGSSLPHNVPHTNHLFHRLVPHGNLSPLHASVHTSGLDLHGGIGSGGHELEPDIVQIVAGTPAASGNLIRSGLAVGEFRIGRATVIMRHFQGSDQVIVIHFIVETEGECSAPVVIVHCDPVPVPHGQCVGHQKGGTLIDNISHTGHLCTGFIKNGHLSPAHGSVYSSGLQL